MLNKPPTTTTAAATTTTTTTTTDEKQEKPAAAADAADAVEPPLAGGPVVVVAAAAAATAAASSAVDAAVSYVERVRSAARDWTSTASIAAMFITPEKREMALLAAAWCYTAGSLAYLVRCVAPEGPAADAVDLLSGGAYTAGSVVRGAGVFPRPARPAHEDELSFS